MKNKYNVVNYKEYLSFRVDDTSIIEDEASYKFYTDWMRSRGLKRDYVGWITVDLSNPNMLELVKDILDAPKHIQFACSELEQKIENDAQWYLLKQRYLCDDRVSAKRVQDKIQVRAERITHGKSVEQICMDDDESNSLNIVSDKFRKTCEKYQLTGIDFYWLEDISKYDTEQYFIPIIYETMGREIKNPYIDKNFTGYDNPNNNRSVEFQNISEDVLKKQDLIHQCVFTKMIYGVVGTICSFPRFFSGYLPKTDFVFSINDWGILEIYISNRAYTLLKEEKILTAQNIETGVEIYETLTDNSIDYLINPEKEKKEEKWKDFLKSLPENMTEYEKFKRQPRPKKVITKKQAFSYLRSLKRNDEERCSKCAPKRWREKLRNILPEDLLELYAITNRCELSDDVETIEIQYIEEETNQYKLDLKQEDFVLDEYEKEDIHYKDGWIFAKAYNGDRFLYANGKVIKILHESGWSIERKWDSLYEFLYEN